MKTIALLLAWYFLMGSLLPRTDFSQLWRLDDLRSHYHEHVAAAEAIGETVSFTRFFYEHFINPDEHEQDHHTDHAGLPLLTIGTSLAFMCNDADLLQEYSSSVYSVTSLNYLNVFHLQVYGMTNPHPPSA